MMSDEKIKELESWIGREINICVEQLKVMTHYQKARTDGFLSALKRVQAKLR